MNNNETNLNLKCSYLSDRNVSISEQGLRKTHKLMKKKKKKTLLACGVPLFAWIHHSRRWEGWIYCARLIFSLFYSADIENMGLWQIFFYRSDVNTEWSIDTTTSTVIWLYIHYVLLPCTFSSSQVLQNYLLPYKDLLLARNIKYQ